jgi:hypothetical protein
VTVPNRPKAFALEPVVFGPPRFRLAQTFTVAESTESSQNGRNAEDMARADFQRSLGCF